MMHLSELPTPVRRALDAYRLRLAVPGDDRPITVAWAPGRINLIGEHTDYNEGYVLPAAIDRVVALAGRPGEGPETHLYSVHHDESARFAASPDALAAPDGTLPTWAEYVRGVLAHLAALSDAAAAAPDSTPTIAPDAPGDFSPPPPYAGTSVPRPTSAPARQ